MASKRAAVIEKNGWKTLTGHSPVHEAKLTPAGMNIAPDRAHAFDPHALLTRLTTGKSIRDYQPGEIVFSQGAVADAVFWIETGEVKLTVVSRTGKEAVVAVLPEASFFGEACLSGRPIRLKTATAVQPSRILRIAKETMVRLLHLEAEFAEYFTAFLLSRNVRLEEDLVDQLFNSSEKRLARLLLLLAHFGREGEPLPILPAISQETLARMVGTTRSRVSFFMNRFRKHGFVHYNGGIRVHSSLLSIVLHDSVSEPEFLPFSNS